MVRRAQGEVQLLSRVPNRLPGLALLAVLAVVAAPGPSRGDAHIGTDGLPGPQTRNGSYRDAVASLRARLEHRPVTGRARNVILFVGDGMSIATVTAARALAGGERLSFERFPHVALLRTSNADRFVPDSAGAMTAIMTGVRTRAGLVGLGPGADRASCRRIEETTLRSALELAELSGRATGVVTTARITHATPAATYAHSPDRGWEDDSEVDDGDCTDIAAQLVGFAFGDGIEVALGGGRRHFLPKSARDPEYADERGDRKDGRDLTREWSERAGASFVWSRAQLAAVDPAVTRHLLGLFEPSHMRFSDERDADPAGEPSLVEMTQAALHLLERGPAGYFLVVEGARIDHAHHLNRAERALRETLELGRAVALAADRTDPDDTLIVVTADHGTALSIQGPRHPNGASVLGDALDGPGGPPERDERDRTFPVLTYSSGPEASVRLDRASHSAEDVGAWARGPWAHLIAGSMDQSEIFHVIAHAAELLPAGAPAPRTASPSE